MNMMKDVTGKEIDIGDTVVTMFDDYSTLVVCRVEKIAKKKIGLTLIPERNKYLPWLIQHLMEIGEVRYKFPDQIAKVE
jgi:hypothetical protein